MKIQIQEGQDIKQEVLALGIFEEEQNAYATQNPVLDADIKKAVKMIKQFNKQNRTKITTEASGGITLRNIRKAALTGVDYISVGAITHSAGSLDIALDIKELCK